MNPDSHGIALLKDHPLFQGLTEEEFAIVTSLLRQQTLRRDEFLIHEGELPDALYIVLQGDFEVLKDDPQTSQSHRIATKGPGDIIGEHAFLDIHPRSASVRAITDSLVTQLFFQDLRPPARPDNSLDVNLKLNIGRQMARTLRRSNDTTVQLLRDQLAEATVRAAAGTFITGLFTLTCAYVFALHIVSSFTRHLPSTVVVTIPVTIAFSLVFARAIKKSGHPAAAYGLTIRNWPRSVADAVLLSVPLFLLITTVKFILLQTDPALHNEPLFSLMQNLKTGGKWMWIEIAEYSLLCPLQELVTRGCVQTTFQRFLMGKGAAIRSILIANMFFSLLHLHTSVLFAAMVFLPGLFWGWLFFRDRSLVGVTLSHVLTGLFAFWVVGFDAVID